MSTVLSPGRTRYVRVNDLRLGSLRSAELTTLRTRLLTILEQTPALLIIECCDLEEVGAGFAGVLAEAHARARAAGTRIRLDHLSDRCRKVMSECGLQERLTDPDRTSTAGTE